MCEFKLNRGRDDYLTPLRRYKRLFPQTNINELSKSIDKKLVLHAYNNPCISQIGICHILIITKDIETGHIFFVVPGNRLASLGMLNCEQLELLIVNWQITDDSHRNDKSTNKQSKVE